MNTESINFKYAKPNNTESEILLHKFKLKLYEYCNDVKINENLEDFLHFKVELAEEIEKEQFEKFLIPNGIILLH